MFKMSEKEIEVQIALGTYLPILWQVREKVYKETEKMLSDGLEHIHEELFKESNNFSWDLENRAYELRNECENIKCQIDDLLDEEGSKYDTPDSSSHYTQTVMVDQLDLKVNQLEMKAFRLQIRASKRRALVEASVSEKEDMVQLRADQMRHDIDAKYIDAVIQAHGPAATINWDNGTVKVLQSEEKK